jgi:3-hydroxyisobutyrate dehydrogenase-like beta-hydroxyacid dehydrogenase
MKPVAMAFSRAVTLMGASGAGQLAKMVNQICIAGAGAGPGRGHCVWPASRAGHEPGAGRDRQGRGAKLADGQPRQDHGGGPFDFGFAVDWMRKDLGLVLDEAKRNGARLPVTAWSTSSMPTCSTWAAGAGTPSLIKRLK